MAEPAIEPIHQFRITNLFDIGTFGGNGTEGSGTHLAFTNSALFMVLTVGLILAFLILGSNRRAIIPGRMQLMAETGEEMGMHADLGWIDGTVRLLAPASPAAKVPHMGWNAVTPTARHPLIVLGEAYFLHSFAFEGESVLARTDHGGPVTAAIGRDNLVGVQFHPEKSQRYGIALLERFLKWRP